MKIKEHIKKMLEITTVLCFSIFLIILIAYSANFYIEWLKLQDTYLGIALSCFIVGSISVLILGFMENED